jgi:hypothetical protein
MSFCEQRFVRPYILIQRPCLINIWAYRPWLGRTEATVFLHFIERIIQRISGWKEKLLSIGAKEILLKTIAQAIPVYAMSVFQIPIGVCKKMTDAIAQFWWGDDENSKKMH